MWFQLGLYLEMLLLRSNIKIVNDQFYFTCWFFTALLLCFFQASDPGSGECGRRAECRAASSAVSDQSAQSREGPDHRWNRSSRNFPWQLYWGTEGRPGPSSINLSPTHTLQHVPFFTSYVITDLLTAVFPSLCASTVFAEVDGDREGEGLLSGGHLLQPARWDIPPDPGWRTGWSEAQHCDGQLAP